MGVVAHVLCQLLAPGITTLASAISQKVSKAYFNAYKVIFFKNKNKNIFTQ
jgi:hypothetical protein